MYSSTPSSAKQMTSSGRVTNHIYGEIEADAFTSKKSLCSFNKSLWVFSSHRQPFEVIFSPLRRDAAPPKFVSRHIQFTPPITRTDSISKSSQHHSRHDPMTGGITAVKPRLAVVLKELDDITALDFEKAITTQSRTRRLKGPSSVKLSNMVTLSIMCMILLGCTACSSGAVELPAVELLERSVSLGLGCTRKNRMNAALSDAKYRVLVGTSALWHFCRIL
jgi:hypothetical protein